MIGTTAAILAATGAAGASGFGKFLGGIFGRGKAKQIGTIEQQAAEDEERRIYERLKEINPQIAEEYLNAQQRLEGTINTQTDYGEDVARRVGEAGRGAAREANTFLDPYRTAGERSLTTLADLANAPAERFDATNLQMDPGYAWRLSEGTKALERSAAARGGLQGGGTLRALAGYSQGLASQEYQSAFNRAAETFKLNQSSRQQQLGTLAGLANLGYGASGQAGQNILGTERWAGGLENEAARWAAGERIGGARDIGNLGIQSRLLQTQNTLNADLQAGQQRARATAARTGSQVAASNAFNQGMQGLFNVPGDALSLYSMMQGGGMIKPTAPTGGVTVPDWVYTGRTRIPGGRYGYGGNG